MAESRLEQERRRRAALKARQGVTTYEQAMGMTPARRAAPLPTPTLASRGSQELELLRSRARANFQDAQRREQALNIAGGEGNPQGGFRGLISDVFENPVAQAVLKPLEILDTPRRAVISSIKEFADAVGSGDASFSDWLDQVKDPTFGAGDFVDTGNLWVDRVLGFVGDVALDPITYLTLGTGAAVKAGAAVPGALGRLAMAEKVLGITKDAEKASAVAKLGLSGARKVLSADELKLLGMPKSGMYFFGKHLPAVRVPLSGGVSEAMESGLTRLRVASTSTKVGGWMQKGVTPQFLREERLQLLRGETPSAEFAEKLVAYNSRNAYRAAASSALRRASEVMTEALNASDVDATGVRQRLHLLLEGVEQPASAAESRALDVWQKAFGTLWKELDDQLSKLDPTGGVGRVQRYFPHVVSDDGRKFLSGGGQEARRLIQTFGMDDLGPTTFFQPRRLVADGETRFFGHLLTKEDLNVKRLNEIARAGGFKGDFFETDIVKVAHRYSTDWADQFGRTSAIADMVDKGTITLLDRKYEIDPSAAADAQRTMAKAVRDQVDAGQRAAEAAVRGAKVVNDHLLGVQAATKAMAETAQLPSAESLAALRGAANEVRQTWQTFGRIQADLKEARLMMAERLSAVGVDVPLESVLINHITELESSIDFARTAMERYEELARATDGEAMLRGERLKEVAAEVSALSEQIEGLSKGLEEVFQFQEWLAQVYDDIVDGVDEVASNAIGDPGRGVSTGLLKDMLAPKGDLERKLGVLARTPGEFADWLSEAAGSDEVILRMMGSGAVKKRLEGMTLAEADRLLQSGLSANQSPRSAQIGAIARVAQVIKFFGGVDQIPEAMRPSFDAAVGAAETFGKLADWERLMATAPSSTSQYERLLQRYGAMAAEIKEDLDLYMDLARQKTDLEDTLLDLLIKADAGEEFLDSRLEKAEKALDLIQRKMSVLDEKEYVFREDAPAVRQKRELEDEILKLLETGGEGGKLYRQKMKKLSLVEAEIAAGTANLGRIARAEVEAIQHTLAVSADRGAGSSTTVAALQQRLDDLLSRPTKQRETLKRDDAAERVVDNARRAEVRREQALLFESGRASRTVSESRRTPMTALQRNVQKNRVIYQSQVRDAERARQVIAERGADLTAAEKEELQRTIREGNKAFDMLRRAGDPNAPWQVQGGTLMESRQDAMFAMEEFLIISEVARRFSVLSERFANVGLKTSDRMLNDVMRSVRARRAPVHEGRQALLNEAATELKRAVARISASGDDDIATAVRRAVEAAYDSLGDAALGVLGPRSAWVPEADALLAKVDELQKSKARTAASSADRKAANDALQEYFSKTVYPYVREMSGTPGRLNRSMAKRILKDAQDAMSARTSAQAVKKLNELLGRLESEASFATRIMGLYRQIDDPDFSAVQAMNRGVRRQVTPSLELAARQAAAQRIENAIDAVAGASRGQRDEILAAASRRKAAAGEAAQLQNRADFFRGQAAKIQDQLDKVTTDANYPLAVQQQEMTNWLLSMAGLDGWKLSADDWAALGVVPPNAYDIEVEGALQSFIDARRAEGRQTFISRPYEMRSTDPRAPLNPFVEVTRASDVPPGAQLLEMAPPKYVGNLTEGQVVAETGYSSSGRSVSEITANQERDLARLEREIAAEQERIAKVAQEVGKAEALAAAGRPAGVFRVDPNGYSRLTNVDAAIQRNLERGDKLTQMFRRGAIDQEEYNLLVRDVNTQFEELQVRRQQILDRGPSRSFVPLEQLQNEALQAQQSLIRLGDQRTALADELARSRRLDDFKNRVQPNKVETLDEYLERTQPGVYQRVEVQREIPGPPPRVVTEVRFQKRVVPANPTVPVPFTPPRPRRPVVEQLFNRAEWESLFAGKPDSLRAANAKKRLKGVEKRMQSERGRLLSLNKQRADAARQLDAARAARSEMQRVGQKDLATFQLRQAEAAQERVALLDDTIAITQANLDELGREVDELNVLALSGSAVTQQAALTKLNALYEGFKRMFPGGLDDPGYKQLVDMSSSGKASTGSEVVIQGRKARLSSQFAASDGAKLLERERQLNRTGWQFWSQRPSVDDARRQVVLADALTKVAEAAAPVRVQIDELRDALGFGRSVAPEEAFAKGYKPSPEEMRQLLFAGTPEEFQRDPFGFARQRLAQEQQAADQIRPQVGTTAGPAVVDNSDEILDRFASREQALRAELAGKQGELRQALADNLASMGPRMQVAAWKKDMDELVELEQSIRGEFVEADQALRAARSKYDQATAVVNKENEAVARAANARLTAERLEKLVSDPALIRRVAAGESMPTAQRTKLRAAIAQGDEATRKLAEARKAGTKLSETAKKKLMKDVKAGNEAAEKLRLAEMSDMELVEANRVYREIMQLFDGYEGPNPINAVLGESLAAEAELLLSRQKLAEAAEAAMYQATTTRLVTSLRDGWVSLESWQLPGLQASPVLKEAMDNISRTLSPGLAKELSEFLGSYTRFFKTYATLSPGFHVRNAMGNSFMVFAAGADLSNMRRGMKLYQGWLGARRDGVAGTWVGSLSKEERDLFDRTLRVVDAAGAGRTVEAFEGAGVGQDGGRLLNNAATRASRRLGEVMEGSGRFMLAYDSVVRGMDFNTASARVKRFLFDYLDTTAVDDAVRNIIPFWIWMSRNLPLQIINQWQNPKAYAIYSSLMRNVAQDDENDVVPSWLKDAGAAKIGDNWYLAPDFGFNRLGEQIQEFTDPARLGSYVNPAIRLPVEMLGQRRLYNNVPFSEKPEEVTGGPVQPILAAVLGILGQTQTTASGDTVVDPKLNYALLNLIPSLSQAERLVPATEGYKARQLGSLLSWAGLPVRQVTDQMREGELYRREREMQQLAAAARNLGYTP